MFLAGFSIGLIVAAQVGPVSLLVVRTVLRGGRAIAVGLAMAVAIAVIDLLYAAVGLAGIGQALKGSVTTTIFGITSAAILITIGVRTAWTGIRARIGLEEQSEVVEPSRAFLTAIAATSLNPLTIALWTVSFPAAAPHAASRSVANASTLLAGVGVGSLLWYSVFSTAVALVRRRLGNQLVRVVDIVSGIGLAGFGGILGFRALNDP